MSDFYHLAGKGTRTHATTQTNLKLIIVSPLSPTHNEK